MFHVPPAMVNVGLVQFPVCWTSGTSTVAGPTTAGVLVAVAAEDPAGAVVPVDPAGPVLLVESAAAVVVEAPPAEDATVPGEVLAVEPDSGGSL